MKLQCKICNTVIDVVEPVAGGIAMVQHVQKKHTMKAMEAMNMIAAYAATHCYTPVIPEGEVAIGDPLAYPTQEAFLETRKTFLKGFKLYADTLGGKR